MPLLQAVNIRHAFGADVILDGVTLSIEPGERVGLVGRNGCGKTTLLRSIAGALTPDAGDIQVSRGGRVGYLKQDPDLPADETLREAAEGAFATLHRLHQDLRDVFERMADADGDELERLLRKQERLEREIEAEGGYAVDHKIDATLHGLGFTDDQFQVECRDLSGGQRSRLALARLLLESPDLLLLDEPTNHLDIHGRMWLENFLRDEFRGAVLMISHDRYLLDRVVARIVEIEHGRLIDYPGSYTAFRRLRHERRITQQRAYEKQQSKFRQQEQFIQKYKTGQRAKEARGRQKKLERERRDEGIEKPLELETFRMAMPKAPRSGETVIAARGLSKAHSITDEQGRETGEEKILFHDLDVTISRGERWGIIGPNGAGKTTLVRTLLGEIEPSSGNAKLGTNVAIGYYRQTHEHVDPDQPVYRFLQKIVRDENPNGELSEQQARDLAGAFLFSGDEQDKTMDVLSGGERSRALLAGLLASAKNLLMLDEPTNHLDIPSAERLEAALSKDGVYEGTLILISHDRALIDATCDHLIVLDGHGGAEVFFGNFTEWLDREHRREQEQRSERERSRAEAERREKERRRAEHAKREKAKAPSRNGLERLRTDQLEQRIEQAESRLQEIDAELLDPNIWRDAKRSAKLSEERSRLASELEPLEFEWSRRVEEAG